MTKPIELLNNTKYVVMKTNLVMESCFVRQSIIIDISYEVSFGSTPYQRLQNHLCDQA
jgi:hypothetical protein